MDESSLCSLCREAQACSFCTCSHSETFICGGCFQAHFAKFPSRVHQNYPLQALEHYKKPGYVEQLHARLEAMEKGKESLSRNVQEIDHCIDMFKEMINRAVATIRDYEQQKIAELSQVKTDLEAMVQSAIEEADKSVYADETDLVTEIAVLLRETNADDELRFFTYELEESKNDAKRPVTVIYSMGSFHGNLVPMITGSTLKTHSATDKTATCANLSMEFNSRTACCFISDDSLLCVGGSDPCAATAYHLTISTHEVTQQESMTVARTHPGVVKSGTFVYVFGGWGESGEGFTSCEKYSLVHMTWQELPDMAYPKAGFWPCAYTDRLFLPFPGQQLEVFDLLNQTFSVISLTFTVSNFDGQKDGVVSFVVDRDIVVLSQDGQCARLRIDDEGKYRISTVETEISYGCVSAVQPIRVGRSVFWVDFSDSSVIRFDVDCETVCLELSPELDEKEPAETTEINTETVEEREEVSEDDGS